MQTTNRFFDEISRVMTGAAGAAQGLRQEAETLIRSQVERMAGDLDLVTREEFDALKAMLLASLAEREALAARVAALEAAAPTAGTAPKKPATARKTGPQSRRSTQGPRPRTTRKGAPST